MTLLGHPDIHKTWVPGATEEYVAACGICTPAKVVNLTTATPLIGESMDTYRNRIGGVVQVGGASGTIYDVVRPSFSDMNPAIKLDREGWLFKAAKPFQARRRAAKKA